MGTVIEIYVNYGCLAAEKRKVYTYGNEAGTAVCSDVINVEIPEDFEVYTTESGRLAVIAPWGDRYLINEILCGDENPMFFAYDSNCNERFWRLKIVE